jgi:ribosomal protein S18 acetylase RimI-like enzyme
MAQLRDRIHPDTFLHEIRLQQSQGYLLAAGQLDHHYVTAAGFRPAHTLSRGPHLFVDDLITDTTHRGQHHGTTLLRYLARYALAHDLPKIYLDSRATAKTFYEQAGFTFLTAIPCWIDAHQLAAP